MRKHSLLHVVRQTLLWNSAGAGRLFEARGPMGISDRDQEPMESIESLRDEEKTNFARPKEPYACGSTGTCGPGTKNTPRNYC